MTTRSVLRVADQAAGRVPDRCVLSGVETTRAVRLTATQWGGRRWLLGVPGFSTALGILPGRDRRSVALPVSVRVWKIWQRRNLAALSGCAAGATFAGIGLANSVAGLVVLGLVVLLVAVAYRTRAHHNYWVTCRLDSSAETIVVEPTHRLFDEEARDLFTRSLR